MTTEEKNEFYNRTLQRNIKSRKSMIIALAVLPVVGVAITLLLGGIGKSVESEIAEATVLDSMSIGEFLEQNETGAAIYTGGIKAVDPVACEYEDGEYIYFDRKVEQETKIYDKKADEYQTETTLISSDGDYSGEIAIDDVVLPYDVFHGLPVKTRTSTEGAKSNLYKTTFRYTPRIVDGTFYLKCKNNEVNSARYYESADVAGEVGSGFGTARVIMWILIIGVSSRTCSRSVCA